jgi:hypothetical protein
MKKHLQYFLKFFKKNNDYILIIFSIINVRT